MRKVIRPIGTPLEKLVDCTYEIPIKNEMTEERKQNETLWEDAFHTGEDEGKKVKLKSELAKASLRTIEGDDDDDNKNDDKYNNNSTVTMIKSVKLLDQYLAILLMT